MSGLTVFFREALLEAADVVGDVNDIRDRATIESLSSDYNNYHRSIGASIHQPTTCQQQQQLPVRTTENLDSYSIDEKKSNTLYDFYKQHDRKEVDHNTKQLVETTLNATNSMGFQRYPPSKCAVGWSDWKKNQKEVLRGFMNLRLLQNDTSSCCSSSDDEQGSDIDENNPLQKQNAESGDSNDDGENDESDTIPMKLETQEQTFPTEKHELDPIKCSNKKRKRKKNLNQLQYYKIPHIDEANNDARYVTDINLYTRNASLQLMDVNKYWRLRNVRRSSSQDNNVKILDARKNQRLFHKKPESHFGQFAQYDGPVQAIYEEVLSIEAIQLIDHSLTSSSTTRYRAERCMSVAFNGNAGDINQNQQVPLHRMMIFFYNNYAVAINKILKTMHVQKQNKGKQRNDRPSDNDIDEHKDKIDQRRDKMLLSFENVPAICILPYPVSDWYDRQGTSRFCLCIGDASKLVLTEADGNDDIMNARNNRKTRTNNTRRKGRAFRFDSSNMIINVATVDGETGDIVEYRLLPVDSDTGVSVQKVSDYDSIILERYVTYQNYEDTISSPVSCKKKRIVNNDDRISSSDVLPSNIIKTNGEKNDIEPVETTRRSLSNPLVPINITHGNYRRCVNKKLPEQKCSEQNTKVEASSQNTVYPSCSQTSHPGVKQGTKQNEALNRNFTHSTRTTSTPSSFPIGCEQASNNDGMLYSKINDLKEVYNMHVFTQSELQSVKSSSICMVNLHGAVLNFKPAILTKRGEWMTTAILVDDSLTTSLPVPCGTWNSEATQQRIPSISLLIFAKRLDQIPQFRYAGDVVRLHRVKLQVWNDELQLVGLRCSSYVVCRHREEPHNWSESRTVDDDFLFFPTSKTDLNLTLQDRAQFTNLWVWTQGRIRMHPTMNPDNAFCISDLCCSDSTYVSSTDDTIAGRDATVMVSAIIECFVQHSFLVPSGMPCGFLRVWDGTGISTSDPLPIDTPAAFEAIASGDPPTSAVVRIGCILRKYLPHCKQPKALIGRVANVLIWEKSHWDILKQTVQVGSFVRLRNVQDGSIPNCNNSHCLQVQSKSGITPLPDYTYEVIKLLENHALRLQRKETFNLNSGLLPLFEKEKSDTFSNAARPPIEQLMIRESEPPLIKVCQCIRDFRNGPAGSFFEGPVCIIDLIPRFSNLLVGGIRQMITVSNVDNRQIYSYRFAITITDATMSSRFLGARSMNDSSRKQYHQDTVDALLSDSAGQVLIGVSAQNAMSDAKLAVFNMRRVLEETGAKWVVTARSTLLNGSKFFLIDLLKRG